MALKSPMMPSPHNNPVSAFSPYSESPTSPQKFGSPTSNHNSSNRSSHLNPQHHNSPLATSSNSDFADPSPIATSSTGTDTTDIDDAVQEHTDDPTPQPPKSAKPGLGLETANAAEQASKPRSDEDEQPNSVIHAPSGFEAFKRQSPQSPPLIRRTTPTAQHRSEIVITPPTDEQKEEPSRPARPMTWPVAQSSEDPNSPPPLQTSVAPAKDWSATPRAQSRAEMELSPDEEKKRPTSRSSSRASNLEDIPESGEDPERTPNPNSSLFEDTVERLQEQKDEVAALNVALRECWTLCNTLAGLSYVHRERIFSFSGKGDRQEQAWKSCWKLCQKLYDTRDEEATVRPTLDLCREFCQCLFDIRRKDNEAADSVLRVSFELNNHLYNTHDRTLPEAFRERTLDFYITLCHRLMKQRTELAQETDLLLGACWSLAEMLFSLRQNKRDGKPADEELLGSAVQACWELCDLFREGWTQIRPDRGTPRPSQTTFTQAFQQAKQSQAQSTTSYTTVPEFDESEDEDFGRLNPETPTTIFEDTNQISPDADESPVPNIMVLGPNEQSGTQKKRPPYTSSTSSSNLSQHNNNNNQKAATSASSNSTSTIKNQQNGTPTGFAQQNGANGGEDPHLTCLKLLLIKAATNVGYTRSSGLGLSSFVKALPSNSFGAKQWQSNLLNDYKKLIASEPGFRANGGGLVGVGRRARAPDVARSVRWFVSKDRRYEWLRDLYRWVFGFYLEEGEGRGDVVVQS